MTLENVNDFTEKYAAKCVREQKIDPALYDQYGVKRGLRDKNGKGVLSGLTSISLIKSYNEIDGKMIPCDGELYYRGYNIMDIVRGFRSDNRFGFEETAYLLLFGDLPTKAELAEFKDILNASRRLPTNFTRDVIMKAPSGDIMNSLTKSILTLASYDNNVSDLSIDNVMRQCLMLISVLPMLAVYGYHAYNHYERDDSLYIHRPDNSLSFAENILRLLRPDIIRSVKFLITRIKVLIHLRNHYALICRSYDLIHIDKFFHTVCTPSYYSCNRKNRCIEFKRYVKHIVYKSTVEIHIRTDTLIYMA